MSMVRDAISGLYQVSGLLTGFAQASVNINGVDVVMLTSEGVRVMANTIKVATDVLLDALLDGGNSGGERSD